MRMLEELRKVHQELMDSLQSLMEFAYPQLLLEFTALFLSCLTKMFFSQEAASRGICMIRQAISMGSLSLWIVIVVFVFCYISQKMKDQVSYAL